MCQQKYDISVRLPPYDTLFTSKCTCESGASLCIHLRAVEAIPDDRDVIFSEGNLAESEKLGRAERIINLCCCCCYSCYSTPQHQCLHHTVQNLCLKTANPCPLFLKFNISLRSQNFAKISRVGPKIWIWQLYSGFFRLQV